MLTFLAMPIYEYECATCGKRFEEIQKITAPPLKKCSLCGAGQVRRLISQTSFRLKGGGWYATEYGRKKSEAPRADKPAKAPDKKDSKGESAAAG
jgi:putative FmdB family regulatory protein